MLENITQKLGSVFDKLKGRGALSEKDVEKTVEIEKLIKNNFDLSPRGIRELLGLNKPIYEITSAYGHFGRKPTSSGEFSWEKTDKKELFKL